MSSADERGVLGGRDTATRGSSITAGLRKCKNASGEKILCVEQRCPIRIKLRNFAVKRARRNRIDVTALQSAWHETTHPG